MGLYLALWCVHFVVTLFQVRLAIAFRDSWPDLSPWHAAVGLGMVVASAQVLLELT